MPRSRKKQNPHFADDILRCVVFRSYFMLTCKIDHSNVLGALAQLQLLIQLLLRVHFVEMQKCDNQVKRATL